MKPDASIKGANGSAQGSTVPSFSVRISWVRCPQQPKRLLFWIEQKSPVLRRPLYQDVLCGIAELCQRMTPTHGMPVVWVSATVWLQGFHSCYGESGL